MLDNRSLIDKLYELPQMFCFYMEHKNYPMAKHCYDTARTVAVFMEIDESRKAELFGERGERGAVIQQGLFPEEKVQRAYFECAVKTERMKEKSIRGS